MTGGRNIRRAVKICLELLLLAMVLLGAVSAVRYGFDRYYRNAYPMKYEELIDSACREKELDRALVYAVVRTESGFNPEAVSNVGAKGLMQMMPDAYEWVRMRKGLAGEADHDDLFDPETNIEYGTSMLKILLDEFGTVDNALCAYHAGWGSVKNWLGDPEISPDGEHVEHIPFKDTAAYVEKVGKTIEIYRRLYDL